MSEMLERVAKAIELAQGNAPFYVMPMFKDKYGVVETMPPLHPDMYVRENLSHEEAENWCEKLNNLWVARKAVEALKPFTINSIKLEMVSPAYKAVFEDGIDAILSGDK